MSKWHQRHNDYIKTAAWRRKRQEAFALYGKKCSRCPKTGKLHVHHKTYVRMGAELMKDLEILCEECHRVHHLPESKGKRRAEKRGTARKTSQQRYLSRRPRLTKQQKMLSAANEKLMNQQADVRRRQQKAKEHREWELSSLVRRGD